VLELINQSIRPRSLTYWVYNTSVKRFVIMSYISLKIDGVKKGRKWYNVYWDPIETWPYPTREPEESLSMIDDD
jgi:hypothetical protein